MVEEIILFAWYTGHMEKYTAFISYRHHPQDIAVAKDVQKRLEHFHIPSGIRKKYGITSLGKVFRDQDELPITSDISANIAEALENSEWLIVICSTHTSSSQWVQREIEKFLETHPVQRVLTVLADGEPSEAIPVILQKDASGKPMEPLSCDYRNGLKEAHRTEIPRLASALIGCAYDELVQREKQYKTKRLTALLSSLSVLTTGAAGYMTWSRGQIQNNLRQSQIRESQYLSAEANDYLEDDQDPITAIQLALAALPSADDPRPLVPDALHVLGKALNVYSVPNTDYTCDRKFAVDGRIVSFSLNDAQDLLCVKDRSGSFEVWDLKSGMKVTPAYDLRAEYAGFVKDGLLVRDDVSAQLLDTDGTVKWTYEADSIRKISHMISGNTRAVLFDSTYMTALDLASGKELSGKKVSDDFTFFWGVREDIQDWCFTEDERYFWIIANPRDGQGSFLVRMDTETGDMKTVRISLNEYALMTPVKDGIALAEMVPEDGKATVGLGTVLHVNICNAQMEQTASFEERISDFSKQLTGFRNIPYSPAANAEKEALAVILNNRGLILDRTDGHKLRDDYYPKDIAVPFVRCTPNTMTHLSENGEQFILSYSFTQPFSYDKAFPDHPWDAVYSMDSDGTAHIFAVDSARSSVKRYTYGIYDEHLEELLKDLKGYYVTALMPDGSLVSVCKEEDRLKVRFTDDPEHTEEIEGKFGSIKYLGFLQGKQLYQVSTEDPVVYAVLAVNEDHTAEILPAEGSGTFHVTDTALIFASAVEMRRIDIETMEEETISLQTSMSILGVSDYLAWNDTQETALVKLRGTNYALLDLKTGEMRELAAAKPNAVTGFSKDGNTVYAISDKVFEDLLTGDTVILPTGNIASAYVDGNTICLLGSDGVLTAADRKDGHMTAQTQLSLESGKDARWTQSLTALYIHAGDHLSVVDTGSWKETAHIGSCIAEDTENGQFYVEYRDPEDSEAYVIGRFRQYTDAELIVMGTEAVKGMEPEESLKARYGLNMQE